MNSAASSKLIRAGTLLAVNLLFLSTWALAGPTKFGSGGVPQWFVDSFGKSVLGAFPGMAVAYYSIAMLETLAAATALVALVKGEFLREARLVWLEGTLVLSLLIFVQLGFGQRLIGDFDKAAMLCHYFAGTAVCLLLVRNVRMEPAAD